MKRAIVKNLGVGLSALTLCTILASSVVTPSEASETPRRGDYPQCQEECVSQLEKRMADLSEEYKRHGNRLLYEEQVEQARSAYDRCVDGCKEVRPVK